MRYLTATQAGKVIGVTDRTIRDWIKEGKLTAHHPAKNRLAIPEHEVQALARERKQYQVEIPDIVEIAQKLADHERRLDDLTERYQDLQQKYRDLEKRLTEQVIEVPVSSFTTSVTAPTPPAQKRATDKNKAIPSELPDGTLAASDFADQLGISYDNLKNYMRRGVSGEKFDFTEVPHPTRAGYVPKFFTLEQQSGAIAVLKKHGKLPTSDETEE